MWSRRYYVNTSGRYLWTMIDLWPHYHTCVATCKIHLWSDWWVITALRWIFALQTESSRSSPTRPSQPTMSSKWWTSKWKRSPLQMRLVSPFNITHFLDVTRFLMLHIKWRINILSIVFSVWRECKIHLSHFSIPHLAPFTFLTTFRRTLHIVFHVTTFKLFRFTLRYGMWHDLNPSTLFSHSPAGSNRKYR